jgi:hypothetical protein
MKFFYRERMRSILFAALLAAAITGISAPAQEVPPAQTPRAATLLLPPRLLPGEQSTLAVLDGAGRLLPGAVVEFPGGERVTTDTTGRAAFVAPLTPGVLTARVVDRAVNASATVIPPQPLPTNGLQLTDYPRVISTTDRFSVDGFGFSGRADGTRVTLGEKPAAVLAASPIALILMPAPGIATGSAELKIEAGGRKLDPISVTVVSLRVIGPASPLAAGQQGTLTVRVRGTEQRLGIEARNSSPSVVDLPRGNVQRVTSSGGPDNQAEIEMTGVASGDFSVSVRLVPGAVGLPDMEGVRKQLLVARNIATGGWQERLDRLIRRIERDPQDVSRTRDELEKMLADQPEAELGRQIEAAWKILLKH